MRKVSLAVLGLGLVAALAPLAAQADHCNSNVVIFSGIQGNSVNSNAAACIADSAHETPYDGRIINPGADSLSVRYILGCGVGEQRGAVLSGSLLGADRAITLTCSTTTTGTAFNSPTIPLAATATGCITATVEDEDAEGTNVTTFHTVGATC